MMRKNTLKIRAVLLSTIITLFMACTPEVTNINYCCHDGDNDGATVTTKGVNIIANVGDSNYGNTTRSNIKTRSVVADDAVKGETLKNAVIALGDETSYYGVAAMTTPGTFEDITSVVKYGTNRGYVFAEANLDNPYAGTWNYSKTIDNGTLTLSATSFDDNYSNPVPVMFWGNYSTMTSTVAKSSYVENTTDAEWTSDEVNVNTQSVAISKNIQYATSVFKPVITVADKIKVYGKNGTSTKEVSRDEFKFTVQYVYVHSAKSVVYGKDFNYSTIGDATYRYALKSNGIFGKTSNGNDVFDSWSNNYANLSILPTNATEVKVVLVCKAMGNSQNVYMWDARKQQYTTVGNSTFYIFGTIKTDETHAIANAGNSLCPTNGSAGVFVPDVKTIANIALSNFTIKNDDGDDTVVIDPNRDDVITKGAFNIDVEYGTMDAEWNQTK